MSSINITNARKDLYKIVDSVNKSHEPIHITGENGSAVLIGEDDSFREFPPYEKLIGDLIDTFSRRLNIQHRIVSQVYEKQKIVKIIRMWTHYE